MRNDLIKMRKEKNISLRQMAKKIDISAAALSKIERGFYNPSFPVADSIAVFFSQPVEKLFPQFKRSSPLHDDYNPKRSKRSDENKTTANNST